MADFKVWDQVPDGARLHLRVAPRGAFIGSARVLRELQGIPLREELVCHAALASGAYTIPLHQDVNCTVRVRVKFLSPHAATVIHAEIRDRGGRPFRSPFRYAVAGSQGDVCRATLLAAAETIDLEHPRRTRRPRVRVGALQLRGEGCTNLAQPRHARHIGGA